MRFNYKTKNDFSLDEKKLSIIHNVTASKIKFRILANPHSLHFLKHNQICSKVIIDKTIVINKLHSLRKIICIYQKDIKL